MDASVIVVPIIQNQALLHTILTTQAQILAKLEERDVDEVLHELAEEVSKQAKLVAQKLDRDFPGQFTLENIDADQ